MAEQEPTPEQLAELAASVEETDTPVNYKPPAQKTLEEIQQLDQDDESLRKYKETLLGATVASEWSAPSDCWHVNTCRIVSYSERMKWVKWTIKMYNLKSWTKKKSANQTLPDRYCYLANNKVNFKVTFFFLFCSVFFL